MWAIWAPETVGRSKYQVVGVLVAASVAFASACSSDEEAASSQATPSASPSPSRIHTIHQVGDLVMVDGVSVKVLDLEARQPEARQPSERTPDGWSFVMQLEVTNNRDEPLDSNVPGMFAIDIIDCRNRGKRTLKMSMGSFPLAPEENFFIQDPIQPGQSAHGAAVSVLATRYHRPLAVYFHPDGVHDFSRPPFEHDGELRSDAAAIDVNTPARSRLKCRHRELPGDQFQLEPLQIGGSLLE